MRSKSIVPTNLLDWPQVKGLLPDQRLILIWLWASPYLSCAGAGFIPIRAAAATLGLSPDALEGGFETLCGEGLIAWDQDTGEVFVNDWFRFHSFRPLGLKILHSSIEKVESDWLKSKIRSKSMICLPTPTSTSTSTSTKSGSDPDVF